jgi:hypothetical protein
MLAVSQQLKKLLLFSGFLNTVFLLLSIAAVIIDTNHPRKGSFHVSIFLVSGLAMMVSPSCAISFAKLARLTDSFGFFPVMFHCCMNLIQASEYLLVYFFSGIFANRDQEEKEAFKKPPVYLCILVILAPITGAITDLATFLILFYSGVFYREAYDEIVSSNDSEDEMA